eukprot:scaffold2839_cov86-Skeletonema_dohrnii-CCMP3373.AAC.1
MNRICGSTVFFLVGCHHLATCCSRQLAGGGGLIVPCAVGTVLKPEEGVPKLKLRTSSFHNILCQGQVLGEGIGVGTDVLRSLIGVGSDCTMVEEEKKAREQSKKMNPLRLRRGRRLYDEIQLYSIIGCKLSSSRGRRGKQRKFLDMINWIGAEQC